jgi:hypothetical protein
MTLPQILSVVAAVVVACLYLRDLVPEGLVPREPETLAHIRNIIAVRDAYKNQEVTARCNALMEALLGIKS